MTCESAERITFNPEGKLETVGGSGQYSADLVFNDGYHSLPWYKTSISGVDCGDISLEQTEDGIIIAGNNLNDVAITVKNDEETQNLQLTTNEESVLLTSEASGDDTKPVIMLDSDGDGIYDEAIRTCTITFDARQQHICTGGQSHPWNACADSL